MFAVGAITAFVALALAGRELLIAQEFGVNDALDSFLIAIMLPAFAITIIAGSFNSAVIPTFIKVREQEGDAAAQRLFSNILCSTAALLLFVAVVLALSFPMILPYLASGFSAQKLETTRRLFFMVLPVIVLDGISTVMGAVLNATRRFALAAIMPALSPVLAIVTLFVLNESPSVYVLPVVLVVGATARATILALALRSRGLSVMPRWTGLDRHTKEVSQQYGPMAIGALLMGLTTVVDQSMATTLGSGAVSQLNFALMAVLSGIGIASVAISAVITPLFSEMAARRDWTLLNSALDRYLRSAFLLTVPIVIVFLLFSETIVSLLFERGMFGPQDTLDVARVQRAFALQIPFYTAGILVVRTISVLRANRILMIAAAINLVVNVLLNVALMPHFGVAGIALSTSTVYVVSFTFSFAMVKRLLRKKMSVVQAR